MAEAGDRPRGPALGVCGTKELAQKLPVTHAETQLPVSVFPDKTKSYCLHTQFFLKLTPYRLYVHVYTPKHRFMLLKWLR